MTKNQIMGWAGVMGFTFLTVPALSKPGDVIKTAAGPRHTCELREPSQVFCWGLNTHGQLAASGNVAKDEAKPLDLGMSKVIDVGVGQEHSCALDDKGAIKCWGGSLYGQLGPVGGRSPKAQQPINWGTNAFAVALGTGEDHTCAALKAGGVKCLGHNHEEQLGIGKGGDVGHRANEVGDNLKEVTGLKGVEVVALTTDADANATCAKRKDRTVFCWGDPDDAARLRKTFQ